MEELEEIWWVWRRSVVAKELATAKTSLLLSRIDLVVLLENPVLEEIAFVEIWMGSTASL